MAGRSALSLLLLIMAPVTRRVEAQAVEPKLHEEMRISGASYALSAVGGMAVSKGGLIAISQPSESKLMFFKSDGRLQGTFGRSGEGPGEFRGIGEFGWLQDTLYVPGTFLTMISPELHLLRTVRWTDPVTFPPEMGASTPAIGIGTGLRIYSDGSRLVVGLDRIPAASGEAPEMGRVYLRVSRNNLVEKALVSAPPDMLPGFIGAMALQTRIAIDPSGEWIGVLTMPDLRAEGPSRRWHLKVVDKEGATVAEYDHSYVAVPISSQVLDSLKSRAGGRSTGPIQTVTGPPPAGGVIPPGSRARRQFTPVAFPPVRRFLLGQDGTVWIERWLEGTEHRWEVFSLHGDPIWSIILKPNTALMVARRDRIWVVERDADDVPSIVRFRLDQH